MIEVTLRFKCPRGVFYLSVKIMDKFFKRNQQALTSPLLHIIGLCCLFIASKFLDCRHRIRLAALQERIAHNKFSSFEIRMTEKLILKKLGFQINLTTCHDFLEGLIEKFKIPKIIAVIADIICKISQIYYEHLEFKPSLIAISALVISSKSVKQHMLAERIQKHQNVDKIVEQISFDVDNFVYKYPDFISIFEFHQVTITSNRPGPLFIFNERELDQDQNRLINNPNCL